MKKVMVLFCAAGLLTGCATTRQPSDLSQLQIKVAHLERKIEDRDRELENIKMKLENIESDVEVLEPYPAERPNLKASADDGDVTYYSESLQSLRDKKVDKILSEDIIRVKAAPRTVQTALKNAGYYKGNIDGKIGSGSKQAIKDFQKDHNLKIDGIVGSNTWDELKAYLE